MTSYYPAGMEYDPEQTRRAIRAHLAARKGKLTKRGWTRAAGLSTNALDPILKPKTPDSSVTLRVLCALAKAEHVHPYVLMGIEPPNQTPTADAAAALKAATKIAETINASSEASIDQLRSVLDLLKLASRDLPQPAKPTNSRPR